MESPSQRRVSREWEVRGPPVTHGGDRKGTSPTLTSSQEMTSDKPKLGDVLHNPWHILLTTAQVMKNKGECHGAPWTDMEKPVTSKYSLDGI